MENYSLQLIWSDEEKGYVATVPEIPHLKSISETAEQAVNEISSAIAVFGDYENYILSKTAPSNNAIKSGNTPLDKVRESIYHPPMHHLCWFF
jgi:predicted RNase H-like HicB family nuclease